MFSVKRRVMIDRPIDLILLPRTAPRSPSPRLVPSDSLSLPFSLAHASFIASTHLFQ